ncbi:MAG: lipocalin family protein [Pseudomonadota bacterium]
MKNILIAFLIMGSTSAFAVPTATSVDLNQYMGQWFQLAAIPQSFAKDCINNEMAEYKLIDDETVEVVNSCDEADGVNVARGRARINPKFDDPAKLQVTFVRFLFGWIWSFGGDYWIIDLDPDYQWSIVGNPDQDALWILSRTQIMDNATLNDIRTRVDAAGFDTCAINMSPNDVSPFSGSEKLCDLKL